MSVLLFLHLLGAFLFLAGAAVAAVLQFAAMRRDRPSEIALLLGLTRAGVVLLMVGSIANLVFGLALAGDQHRFDEAWVSAAIALWVVAMVLGGWGGQAPRRARELAERLAREGDRPAAELQALVADRQSLVLNTVSTACVLAILGLMVWQPT